jgi:serine/threonine protein kinase
LTAFCDNPRQSRFFRPKAAGGARKIVVEKSAIRQKRTGPCHQAAARLQHPNIVQVLEVRENSGRPFLTLEFVSGGSLAQLLRQERPEPATAAERN